MSSRHYVVVPHNGKCIFALLTQSGCGVLEELIFLAFVEPRIWEKAGAANKGIGLILLEAWCFYSSRRGDIPSAAVAPSLLTLALGLTDKGFFGRNVL